MLFLAGHAVSYAGAIPYWPVRELLRGWLGLGGSDSEARVRLELRAELARTLDGQAEEAYPFLATVLGVTLEPEQERRLRDFARDAVQRQTFDWLSQLVAALARERPLCLVLEDLHWSDGATLALLDELLPAAEQTAVAFLLVHRSDPDHPAWQLVDRARRRFRRLFFELELEPLADADARALAEADAGGELQDELAQLLGERAGGNPYFVGEAVRDLLERGALEREHGRLALAGDVAIPAAIQEALQARLDRLDGEQRELLTTAAVIGRSFGLPLLERLLPGARLVPTLSGLQWLRLVVEERSGAAPEYRFRHGLVQEAAYGTLLDARRRELHLRGRRGARGAAPRLAGGGVRAARPPLRRGGRGRARGRVPAQGGRRGAGALRGAGGDRAVPARARLHGVDRRRRGCAGDAAQDRAHPPPRVRVPRGERGIQRGVRPTCAGARAAGAERARSPGRCTPAWDREVAPGYSASPRRRPTSRSTCSAGSSRSARVLEIEPDLAERFTVSDDGRSYRFTLRADALWSDGDARHRGRFRLHLRPDGRGRGAAPPPISTG